MRELLQEWLNQMHTGAQRYSPQTEALLDAQITQMNYARMVLICSAFFIMELAMILYGILGFPLNSGRALAYIFCYVYLAVISLAVGIIALKLRHDLPFIRKHPRLTRRIVLIYGIGVIVWGACIMLLDVGPEQSGSGVAIYVGCLFGVTCTATYRPMIMVPLLAIVQTALMCVLYLTPVVTPQSSGLLINTASCTIMACMCGVMGYSRERHRTHLQILLQERNAQMSQAAGELERLSNTDDLTGLPNHRFFSQHLALEWAHCRRERRMLSVLMIDVDCFKQYNDTYSHIAGNDCLKRLASVIRSFARRPGDLAVRYGGEEFVLLLRTNAAGALNIAQQLCQKVRELGMEHKSSTVAPTVTLSIGVYTCIPDAQLDEDAFVGCADQAMYAAKAAGRNRVAIYEEEAAL